jgi:hypothetical protein
MAPRVTEAPVRLIAGATRRTFGSSIEIVAEKPPPKVAV